MLQGQGLHGQCRKLVVVCLLRGPGGTLGFLDLQLPERHQPQLRQQVHFSRAGALGQSFVEILLLDKG